MRHVARLLLAVGWLMAGVCFPDASAATGQKRPQPVEAAGQPGLFVWSDTCNVYVIRDGEAAILIDLGDGSVLDHLGEIGVKRVEWVLFTHHHREQCQGAPRLEGSGTQIAVPEAERELFEKPAAFRKMQVRLGDRYTIHGASYVRPPRVPVRVDRGLRDGETFTWRGRELRCMSTVGNSPGGMSYVLGSGDKAVVFSGDVMLDGAKMHTWYDTEWDYGFAAGLQALRKTVDAVAKLKPAIMLPSHGPAVREPQRQLAEYAEKLAKLEKLYVRGYEVGKASEAYHDTLSQATPVPEIGQISPHLFKIKRADYFGNFGLILADSGRALVVDCGLIDTKTLDAALEGMRKHFGLKAIDAVVVTHMHGDHVLEVPHLRDQWGAKVWALDRMVDVLEHPERFDYAAPIQAYGKKLADGSFMTGLKVDRAFKPGETFRWEGFEFTVDWMPGQTEFALCLHGQIDGRKVAFTGDNLFGNPRDPQHTGHEAVVAHNSAILDEGYIVAGEYLMKLQPDLLMGGHSFVMDRPREFIQRFRDWSYEMRTAFQALSSEEDYRYWFDPFWVRAEPYRIRLRAGDSAYVTLHVRNFRAAEQRHLIEVCLPPGLSAEPAAIEGKLAAEARGATKFRLRAAADAAAGVRIVAFDIALDGRRYGERFDAIVEIAD